MKERIKDVIIAVEIILIITLIIVNIFKNMESEEVVTDSVVAVATDEKSESVKTNSFFVDVKGEVKKPGVYLVNEGDLVNDAITLAGGLTKKATTKNINLSEEVKKSMVIYVFSKNSNNTTTTISPISNTTCTTNVIEVKECDKEIVNVETQSSNSLINLNTATKTELMTLPGIGEAKADQIILYRKDNRFETIEDVMKVSGIGESYFAKIKDFITV